MNILTTFKGVASRIGSSFDVLSFVVSAKDLFVPYANLTAEFVTIINGYWPGEFIKVDSPQWARILPALGHHTDVNLLIKIGTGDNLGFIPHLFINFGIFGVCFWSFLIMFLYGISYNYFNLFMRINLLFMVILRISNGSGFIEMVTFLPIFLFYLMVLRVTYRIIRPFLQVISSTFNSKTIQINNSPRYRSS